MFGIPISRYGSSSVFQQINDLPIPRINRNEVLIKIKSTSVNPIDLMKREGYGKTIFEKQRKQLFPWILGSDVSGIVIEVGSKVTRFKEGDEIYGSSSNPNSGTYCEYAAFNQNEIEFKPNNLSFNEAASLPYVAITTWTALIRWAGIRPQDLKEKKVFIQAGAGGVGTFAIQLLKYWGAKIATTCSESNHALVKKLGAEIAIDYNKKKFHELLENYDLVFDCLGDFGGSDSVSNCLSILKEGTNSHYITLNHQFLRTIDEKGLLFGVPSALRLRQQVKKEAKPINMHWSIYRPSPSGLSEISRLVDSEIIKPVIDSVYPLKNIIEAHEKVGTSHSKGKVVIEVEKND
tara:strand:- start:13388 stop:14431 length:1044 start_codon:yes stop_codon:yes gene_type:complete